MFGRLFVTLLASGGLLISGCDLSAHSDSALPGDADGNGKLDVWDVRSISRSLQAPMLGVPNPKNADVTQNGKVDQGDLEAIDKRVNGLSTIGIKINQDDGAPAIVGDLVCVRVTEGFLPLNVKQGKIQIRSAAAGYDSGEQPLAHDKDGRSLYYQWNTSGLKPGADYDVTVTLGKLPDDVKSVPSAPSPSGTSAATSVVQTASVGAKTAAPIPMGTAVPTGSPVSTSTAAPTGTADVKAAAALPALQWSTERRLASLVGRQREIPVLASAVDLFLPYWDVGLAVSRQFVYESSRPAADGPLGYGWTHAYDLRLAESTDGAISVLGCGPRPVVFRRIKPGTYEAGKGEFSRLSRDKDGSFVLLLPSGARWGFSPRLAATYYESEQGRRITFLDDTRGRLQEARDGSGQALQFEYGPNDRISSVRDSTGRTAAYEYDDQGCLTKATVQGVETRYAYDQHHRLTKIEFADERVRTFAYDDRGRIQEIRGAKDVGVTIDYSEPKVGPWTRTISDGEGFVCRQQVGDSGLIVGIDGPPVDVAPVEHAPAEKTADKTADKRAADGTPPAKILAAHTPREKTPPQKELPEKAPTGKAPPDDAPSEKGPPGPPAVGEPRGEAARRFTYDDRQHLVKDSLPGGIEWGIERDELDRETALVDPLGHRTIVEYDTQGEEPAAVKDPNGYQTRFRHLPTGPLTHIRYPDGTVEVRYYSTTPSGTTVKLVNRGGQAVHYDFDLRGLLSAKRYPDGTSCRYAYDRQGRLLAAENEWGKIEFQYDAQGRPVRTIFPGGRSWAFHYEGNRTVPTARTDPDGHTIRYEYDSAGRLGRVLDDGGCLLEYEYSGASRKKSVKFADAVKADYSYRSDGSLKSLEYRSSVGKQCEARTFEYDDCGRLIRTAVDDGSAPRSYRYDPCGRLAAVDYGGGASEAFKYDPAGNRVEWSVDGRPRHVAANVLNQTTAIGDEIDDFDVNGNLNVRKTPHGEAVYEYDFEGRLVRITLPDKTVVAYEYDALGRPASRFVGAQETRLLWQDGRLLSEEDARHRTLASYLGAPGSAAPAAMRKDGRWYFFLDDGLGDIERTIDAEGSVVASARYSAFGGAEVKGEEPLRFGFAGSFFDPLAKLNWISERWYSPEIGGFLQPEPAACGLDHPYALWDQNPLRLRGGQTPTSADLPTCVISGKYIAQTPDRGGYLGDSLAKKVLEGGAKPRYLRTLEHVAERESSRLSAPKAY